MGAEPHFALLTPVGYRPMSRDATIPPPDDGDLHGMTDGMLDGTDDEMSDEARAMLAEVREQLSGVPAEVVVANHAMGLYELAAIHLSNEPANLEDARLAIDALGCLVEGLGDRLGEHTDTLQAALANIRMVFVRRS